MWIARVEWRTGTKNEWKKWKQSKNMTKARYKMNASVRWKRAKLRGRMRSGQKRKVMKGKEEEEVQVWPREWKRKLWMDTRMKKKRSTREDGWHMDAWLQSAKKGGHIHILHIHIRIQTWIQTQWTQCNIHPSTYNTTCDVPTLPQGRSSNRWGYREQRSKKLNEAAEREGRKGSERSRKKRMKKRMRTKTRSKTTRTKKTTTRMRKRRRGEGRQKRKRKGRLDGYERTQRTNKVMKLTQDN